MLNKYPDVLTVEQLAEVLDIGMNSAYKLVNDNVPFKLDKVTKVMLITTLAIVSVLTIFTFIWGII